VKQQLEIAAQMRDTVSRDRVTVFGIANRLRIAQTIPTSLLLTQRLNKVLCRSSEVFSRFRDR
jgi:hypothetical protein